MSAPYRASAKISHRAWFSPEEYKQLYEATRKRAQHPKQPRFRWEAEQLHDYVLFSANTGLRPDEAMRLQFRDVKIVEDEGTHDPRRQQGVSVYREEERAFSVGDRVQLTAPARELGVANRELGSIVAIRDERIALKMEDGRSVEIDPAKHPHLDHGYAVTSHSSQGQTAERVLVHVDTELGAKDLLNNRMAYVAISRGARDAQLFTNDREKLPVALGHDVSHQSAHAPQVSLENGLAAGQPEVKQQFDHGHGLSM
jgi:integrase